MHICQHSSVKIMPTVRLLCLMVILMFSNSCAHRHRTPDVYNPMPELWKSIADRIDAMEREHAPDAVWRENKDSGSIPQEIRTASELFSACPAGYPSQGLQTDFARSTKVVHYGFECDYHAIVFFDADGRAWKVIKH